MARKSGPSRAPGVLLAEVALVVLLLAGLVLAWPAGVPTGSASETAATVLSAPRSLQAADFQAGPDDMAPARNIRRGAATAPPAPTAPPVQLFIPSLNLHPRVESIGLERSGAMAAPRNYFDVGWYNGGPVPGDPGDAVIDGHAGYPGQPLVFARLAKLRSGDRIVVVLADGTRRAFVVNSVKSWSARAHPTGLFEPDGPPRLSLITCSGQFNDKNFAYADRLVVEASYAAAG